MRAARLFAALVLSLSLFICLRARAAPPLSIPRAQEPSHAAAAVGVFEGKATCTGFIARRNAVLTAAHCVSRLGATVEILFEDGETATGVVVGRGGAEATSVDLALVQVPTLERPWLALAVREQTGRPCTFVGFGGGGGKIQSVCEVDRLGHYQAGTLKLRVWAIAIPGDSGGPVLDEDGDVIGVTVWRSFPFERQALYAVPLPAIEAFLAAF